MAENKKEGKLSGGVQSESRPRQIAKNVLLALICFGMAALFGVVPFSGPETMTDKRVAAIIAVIFGFSGLWFCVNTWGIILNQGPLNLSLSEQLQARVHRANRGLLYGLGIFALFIVAAWLGDVIVLPFMQPDASERHQFEKRAIPATEFAISSIFTGSSGQIRLEPDKANGVEIFIAQSDLDSVPYPDRKEYVALVGMAWCNQVEHFALPTVTLRDIRSGKNLAHYSCVFEYARLSE